MTTPSRQASEDHTHPSLAHVAADTRAEIDSHEMDGSIKLMDIVTSAPPEISSVEKVPTEEAQHSNQFQFADESNSQEVAEQTAQNTNTMDAENGPPNSTTVVDVNVNNANAISADSLADPQIATENVSEPNEANVNHMDTEAANVEHTNAAQPATAHDSHALETEDTAADDLSDGNGTNQVVEVTNVPLHEPVTETEAQNTANAMDSDADSSGSEKPLETTKSDAEQAADADHAAATAAAAAAIAAAAAVSSGVASSTVPTMTVPMSSIMTPPAAYQPFGQITPNGTPLIPHSLVSMPMSVGRRAVRIAPMGVLPLPPQGGMSSALAADLQTQNAAVIMAAPSSAHVDGSSVEANLHSPAAGAATQPVPELTKGKRRGVSGSPVQTVEGLTSEERTKQKRMLRNRESAARSRDKRKTKNIQLQSAIEKHKEKKKVVDETADDLKDVVAAMQLVLKKHKIALPLF